MKISRKPMKADVPSVAMGDIAFNLLIFFVILARANDDSHVQWTPAQAKGVERAQAPRASVAIDKEGKIYLDGRHLGEVQLRPQLEELLGNASPGQRVVQLKIDRDTPAEKFERVIEAVSEVGGEALHVLEEERNK